MHRLAASVFFTLLLVAASRAQTAGAGDYALGGSSVMWLPHSGSLFLNPAELARGNQAELFFTSRRFNTLSAFGVSYFIPFIGTLAGGVAPFGSASQYSIGFGRRIGRYHSFGVAMSGFRKTEETFGLSFGGSLHFPASTETSGFHAGFSVVNVSDQTKSPLFSANGGAGYWILSDVLRIQAAYQHTPVKNSGLVGSEVMIGKSMSVLIGSRSFEDVSGGISIYFLFGSIQISAGKAGAVLSLSASLSQPAATSRSIYHEMGQSAFDEERYFEAGDYFRTAFEYDRYFSEAQQAAGQCDSILEALTGPTLAQAQRHLANKRFLEASKAYAKVVRMNSGHPEARRSLREIQPQMQTYYFELVTAGDSLRNRREIEKARRNYQLALELDPGNDSLTARIADLKEVARSNVRTILNRANSYLNRNQLDEAQREYERVLSLESRNSRALQGLEMIRGKRIEEVLQKGISSFNESDYLSALGSFLQVLEKDPRNREAADLLAQTRRLLKPEVENLFRTGLQFYTKDNFKSAIEEWDRALLIDPEHPGTIEYKKRAEEKLQALEKLK